MPKSKTEQRSSTVVTDQTIDVDMRAISGLPKLVAFRMKRVTEVSVSQDGSGLVTDPEHEVETKTGIALRKDMQEFLHGKTKTIPPARHARGKYQGFYMAVTDTYIAGLREYGWMGSTVPSSPDYGKGVYSEAERVRDPLAALESGLPCVVIEMFEASHKAFDLDGVPYPVAMGFGYMDGYFDNRVYHLEKAVEILLRREDIELYPNAGERWPRFGSHSKVDYINRVPSYNAGDGRDECIAFKWKPDRETYLQVWEKALSYHAAVDKAGDHAQRRAEGPGTFELHRAIFELDIWGLRAGGAAKFSAYGEHEEPAAEKDDAGRWTEDDDE